MNAINNMIKIYPFAKAEAVKAAIALVQKAVKEEEESPAQQELLDEAHDLLDVDLVRDFSGQATSNPRDIVQIVKNCYVLDGFACEVTPEEGEAYFIYLPADGALIFLQTVLDNMDRQLADIENAVAAPTNKALNGRKYKSIRKAVVAAFDEQVVSMLGEVAGKELSLDVATEEGCVFADNVTDAMFYAWSCNFKHEAVSEGCIYDYLASGDKNLLK